MGKKRLGPTETLSKLLASDLTVEELEALTAACAGDPKLERLAVAAERALERGPLTDASVLEAVNYLLDRPRSESADED